MFYKTQIKSVTDYGAVDVNGRPLRFIGYLPVKAGDSVFTDGRFIFGNAPPKGAPAVFDEPSVIPVLGDFDSQGNELRGYVTMQGKYKKYKIKGDEWLVNDKNIYVHDNGETNIIDAELAADGSVFTVEKSVSEITADDEEDFYFFYHHNQHDFFLNREHYFYSWKNLDTSTLTTPFQKSSFPFWITLAKADFATQDDISFKKCDLIIKKDGNIIESVDLFSQIGEIVKYEAQKNINIEVNNDLVLERWNWPSDPAREPVLYVDYIESFKIRGNLLNFKILNNGKWTALIKVTIWAQRDFPTSHYGELRQSEASAVAHMIFVYKIDSEGNTKEVFRRGKFFPLLDNQWTFCTGVYASPDEYWAIVNRNKAEFANKTFPYVFIISDGTGTILIDGKISLYLIWCVEWNSRYAPNAPDYDNELLEIADDFTFPVQDGFQAKINNLDSDPDLWQFGGILDAENNLIVDDFFSNEENAHKWNTSFTTLKGGQFLFGIRKDTDRDVDGALYKIDSNGNVEQVSDGLKNFRLRELKKISKAKK